MITVKNFIGSLFIVLTFLTVSSFAATYTVTNTTDIDDGGNCDANCSLREAVNRANQTGAADTIVFSALFNSPQTITLGSELQITNDLTISGPSGGLAVSGNGSGRVFNISSGVTAAISDLTITGGSVAGTGGGGLVNAGTLTLNRVTLRANSSFTAFGGGIRNDGTITIINSTLSGNSAFIGGAIFNASGTLIVVNSTIAQNTASLSGGGISTSAVVSIRNTIVAGNTGGSAPDVSGGFNSQGHNFIGAADGGTGFTDGVNGDQVGSVASPKDPMLSALANNGGPTPTHALLAGSTAIDGGDNCVLTNTCSAPSFLITTDQRGTSRPQGASVDIGSYEYAVSTFTVTKTADTNLTCLPGNCSLREAIQAANASPDLSVINFAPLFNTPQTITLTDLNGEMIASTPISIVGPGANLLTVNQTVFSRVFVIQASADVSMTGLSITGARGVDQGGGIFNLGTLDLSAVAVCNNSSEVDGGGIDSVGTLTIRDSLICNNSVSGSLNGLAGGGIALRGGSATLVNVTVSGNSATDTNDGRGGGISVFNATLNLVNVTIANNSARITGSGGGISAPSFGTAVVNLRNTIVANNTAGVSNTPNDIATDDPGFMYSSFGHNIVEAVALGIGFTNGVNNDIVGVDPNIGALANNGGPTMTHALLINSPAIDSGDNCVLNASCTGPNPLVNTDQRGVMRPQSGVVDIGAFEILAPTAAHVSISGIVTDGVAAIRGAIVTLTEQDGTVHTTRTNAFGFFTLTDIEVGQGVFITVSAKAYTFEPLFLSLSDEISGLVISPSEPSKSKVQPALKATSLKAIRPQ